MCVYVTCMCVRVCVRVCVHMCMYVHVCVCQYSVCYNVVTIRGKDDNVFITYWWETTYHCKYQISTLQVYPVNHENLLIWSTALYNCIF